MINSTLETDVSKKMYITNKRTCEEIDVDVDNETNMTQVYDKKCDETKVIEDVIKKTKSINNYCITIER